MVWNSPLDCLKCARVVETNPPKSGHTEDNHLKAMFEKKEDKTDGQVGTIGLLAPTKRLVALVCMDWRLVRQALPSRAISRARMPTGFPFRNARRTEKGQDRRARMARWLPWCRLEGGGNGAMKFSIVTVVKNNPGIVEALRIDCQSTQRILRWKSLSLMDYQRTTRWKGSGNSERESQHWFQNATKASMTP